VNPVKLGDKIKNRRLELELTQKEAGRLIGVEREGLCDWENHVTEPTIELYPAIIQFLGYVPFSFQTETIGEEVKKFRYLHGLSQDQLARKLGIGSATIHRLEAGVGKVNTGTMRLLQPILGLK